MLRCYISGFFYERCPCEYNIYLYTALVLHYYITCRINKINMSLFLVDSLTLGYCYDYPCVTDLIVKSVGNYEVWYLSYLDSLLGVLQIILNISW